MTITGKYSRNFTMPTLEASEEEVPTPKITFNVKAKTTTQGLSQAIEDAQLVVTMCESKLNQKINLKRVRRFDGCNNHFAKR